MDFLFQAKARGFVVPEEGLRRGSRFCSETAASDSYDDTTRAYAFYVLARAGQGESVRPALLHRHAAADMKTAHRRRRSPAPRSPRWATARAPAHAFGRARDIALAADPTPYEKLSGDYGSLLRDIAGTTALAAEGGARQSVAGAAAALAIARHDAERHHHAGKGVDAARGLRAVAPAPAAQRHDERRSPCHAARRRGAPGADASAQLARGLTFKNKGQLAVWRTVSVHGRAGVAAARRGQGLTLTRPCGASTAQLADLASLHQNDRVLVVIDGKMANNYYRRMAVIDLLPAGLEIETTLSGDEGKAIGVGTAHRDRRGRGARRPLRGGLQHRLALPAARPIPTSRRRPSRSPIPVAYIARAVTVGHFAMPAAVVEDMYAPEHPRPHHHGHGDRATGQ